MGTRWILAAMLACSGLPSAAWGAAAGPGTSGGQFLTVGVGARPLAMGSAFAAVPDAINAVNWNPAALGGLERENVTASYNSLFQDENQGFIGYGRPIEAGKSAWSAGVNYLMVSNIEKRAGDTESADSTFSNQNYAISGTYARAMPIDGLFVGGTAKYIRESLDTFKANAAALDAGALYKTRVEGLSFGAVVRNLGTKLGPDTLPLFLKGGAAYSLGKSVLLAADADWYPRDQRAYGDFGVEARAAKALVLRAGYQMGHGQDQLGGLTGLSLGTGVSVDHLRFDYAFLPFGNLGDTHRVTLGWMF